MGRHVVTLAWGVATLFVLLALAGFDPGDWPARDRLSLVPGGEQGRIQNACGPVGALVSYVLMAGAGAGAFWLVWGLGVGGYRWVVRQERPSDVASRLAGLSLLVAVTAASFSALEILSPGVRLPRASIYGSGGMLGAAISSVLEGGLGPVGRWLVLAAIGLLGLWLVGDLVIPHRVIRHFQNMWVKGEVQAPVMPRTAANLPYLGSGAAGTAGLAALSAPVSVAMPLYAPPKALPGHGPVGGMGNGAGQGVATGDPRPVAPAYTGNYELPPLDLLEPGLAGAHGEHETKLHERAMILEKTLLEHGCVVRVVQIETGPVITQFEIELEAGLRLSKVAGLSNDLAIALAVQSVRIVAPLPGKSTVGIEVPNDRRSFVRMVEVIEGTAHQLAKTKIPIFLGKDVRGTPILHDLADMPHLLIAGRTGTGKSVCLNAIILSILMTRRPDEVKLILFDPKMVELSQFKKIPHLMHPPVTDMKKAESMLAWACEKMDERYAYLARAGVRNIAAYNALGAEELYTRLRLDEDEDRSKIPVHMPYIVIIADELADLMMTAAKEVEQHIIRLAQKARASGIHLILATQRPTVDVITGLIKANMPARIGFQVTSRNDSRVIMDEMGAEKLLGNGDLLFMPPNTSHIVRAQGTYASDAELNAVCKYLERYPVEYSKELTQLQVSGALSGKDRSASLRERDELYEAAIEIVIREQRGSCSLLQRALGIGYGRAARLIDFMAEDGIVGEFKSGSAREVLYSWEDWESLKNGSADDMAA
jgi:S-DNA-T family DNA segregation ATPase FtsK/SpoIIIE